MRSKELSLYIHIPFCVRKCVYCDFLSFSADDGVKNRYVERLCCEIGEAAALYKDRNVISVFFGGGTPSILRAEETIRLTEIVRGRYKLCDNAEISIEVNPGTADIEKFRAYKKAGINRISIGCQSLDDRELEILGRIHREKDFYRAFREARDAGFDNINVDIMSALPGQTAEDYERNLRKLTALRPEHISAYSLIIEEGTPFYEKYHSDVIKRDKGDRPDYLPDEDEERRMLYSGRELMMQAGYRQYEISNYSLPGCECRHNKVYWQRGDYAGFGLGASSCIDECRWKITDDIEEYLSGDNYEIKREYQRLDEEQQRGEAMFLGLRLTEGVDIGSFADRYGDTPQAFYGEWIEKMSGAGLLEEKSGKLMLTLRGQDLANYVMAGFV